MARVESLAAPQPPLRVEELSEEGRFHGDGPASAALPNIDGVENSGSSGPRARTVMSALSLRTRGWSAGGYAETRFAALYINDLHKVEK